jgi:DNA-binding response OmpR family regulator
MKQVSVLLVSGKKDDYEFIRNLLSEAKYTLFCFDWADSFDAGLLALSQKHYDIALVEDDLGIARGSQFIQKAEQKGFQVPVILFTCSDCWEGDEAAFESDAIYCLTRNKMTSKKLEELILKELDWELRREFFQF